MTSFADDDVPESPEVAAERPALERARFLAGIANTADMTGAAAAWALIAIAEQTKRIADHLEGR